MRSFLILMISIISTTVLAQDAKPTIYLLPGQGADYRLFSKLDLGNHPYQHIIYHIPKKGSSMKDYAIELSKQIDQTKPFILIGTSIGGMLSCEMNEFLNPEKIIIISSAQNKDQLPAKYNFQKKLPLYKLVSKGMAKRGALIMQPIVEPDRNKEKEIFVSMLKAKDKEFMKRSIQMIIEWDKESYDESIIHIHGEHDNTIPIKNVNHQYMVKEGSHMITLTRSQEINNILKEVLEI